MLHHTATHKMQWDSFLNWQPKYSPQERQEVLGQRFGPKVKFCHKIGWIDEREKKFILSGHEYRNELYHVGVSHEAILYNLAWHYHQLGCDLLSRFRQPGYVITEEHLTPAVRGHVGDRGIQVPSIEEGMRRTADSLKAAKPSAPEALGVTLASAASRQVEDFSNSLSFLAEDGAKLHGGRSAC